MAPYTCFLVLLMGAVGRAAEPVIRLVPPAADRSAVIDVVNLGSDILSSLKEKPPSDWTALLSIRVASAETAMLGTYRIDKDVLRFEPRFPLVPGEKYRVTFDPTKLPGGAAKVIVAEVSVPKAATEPTGIVEQIYPSRDDLPENQLKFYLHFSKPMSRGEAYKRIHLLNDDGKPVFSPFLELDEELWTPDGKRFTLFLHPGRVKRGLKPREELGPILEEGKHYTLVVDAAWPDEDGNPLKAEFRKKFSAGKPDDEQPDPKHWRIEAPKAGSVAPLLVAFPKSLDHALLQRMVWVVDADGNRVAGTIRIGAKEMVWGFRPEKAWPAGSYKIMVNSALEDLAGNSVASPFEVDVFRQVQRKVVEKTTAVPFSIH